MLGGEPNNQQLTIIKQKDVVDYFMSVHIFKYRLKWRYGLNVSSAINVRFCAYCTHFPGIDSDSTSKMVVSGVEQVMSMVMSVLEQAATKDH